MLSIKIGEFMILALSEKTFERNLTYHLDSPDTIFKNDGMSGEEQLHLEDGEVFGEGLGWKRSKFKRETGLTVVRISLREKLDIF